MTNIK